VSRITYVESEIGIKHVGLKNKLEKTGGGRKNNKLGQPL
jgi:hypothetical protein